MTTEDRDDNWLAALSGGETGTDDADQREGKILRKVVRSRIEKQGMQFAPTEAGLAKVEILAREQGLLLDGQVAPDQSGIAEFLFERLRHLLPTPTRIAESMIEAVTGVVGSALANGPPALVLRGSSQDAVVLRVEDVSATVSEWQRLFLDARLDHATLFDEQGRALLHLKLTPEAVSVLCEKNIQPPSGDWCTLMIESEGKSTPKE